jgi:hypothetical protein
MLKFNGAWRFDSPGAIPQGVIDDFFELIGRIVAQGECQKILELFMVYFASAIGSASSWSSSASWAETDLHAYMDRAAENAPLLIEAFHDACETLHKNNPDLAVPDVARMNRMLSKNEAGYEIQPPNLISRNPQEPIVVPQRASSLDEQAQEIIQQSLKQSEDLLSEGCNRQAVQEILWLLETVSTAFQSFNTGSSTIQGKYFNKIAEDLRKHQKGKTLDQVLN